jgi:hypothetical protein
MRNQLFRTQPVLISGANAVVALVDVDGVEPFTLFVENLDLKASLTTVVLFKSKNANLTFTAVTAGAGGNAVRVAFTLAASQAFSIGVAGNDITINLACDAQGFPNQEANLARNVMDALNASGPASALITTTLAPGSDGSAQCDATVALTNLAGGAAATALASVEVAVSDLPPAQTPATGWIVNTAAATAFGALAGGVVGAYEFTANKTGATEISVARGLRVRASRGAADTRVVAAGIRKLAP